MTEQYRNLGHNEDITAESVSHGGSIKEAEDRNWLPFVVDLNSDQCIIGEAHMYHQDLYNLFDNPDVWENKAAGWFHRLTKEVQPFAPYRLDNLTPIVLETYKTQGATNGPARRPPHMMRSKILGAEIPRAFPEPSEKVSAPRLGAANINIIPTADESHTDYGYAVIFTGDTINVSTTESSHADLAMELFGIPEDYYEMDESEEEAYHDELDEQIAGYGRLYKNKWGWHLSDGGWEGNDSSIDFSDEAAAEVGAALEQVLEPHLGAGPDYNVEPSYRWVYDPTTETGLRALMPHGIFQPPYHVDLWDALGIEDFTDAMAGYIEKGQVEDPYGMAYPERIAEIVLNLPLMEPKTSEWNSPYTIELLDIDAPDTSRAQYGHPVVIVGRTIYIGPLGTHHADVKWELIERGILDQFNEPDAEWNIWPERLHDYSAMNDPEQRDALRDWAISNYWMKDVTQSKVAAEYIENLTNEDNENDWGYFKWAYDADHDKLFVWETSSVDGWPAHWDMLDDILGVGTYGDNKYGEGSIAWGLGEGEPGQFTEEYDYSIEGVVSYQHGSEEAQIDGVNAAHAWACQRWPEVYSSGVQLSKVAALDLVHLFEQQHEPQYGNHYKFWIDDNHQLVWWTDDMDGFPTHSEALEAVGESFPEFDDDDMSFVAGSGRITDNGDYSVNYIFDVGEYKGEGHELGKEVAEFMKQKLDGHYSKVAADEAINWGEGYSFVYYAGEIKSGGTHMDILMGWPEAMALFETGEGLLFGWTGLSDNGEVVWTNVSMGAGRNFSDDHLIDEAQNALGDLRYVDPPRRMAKIAAELPEVRHVNTEEFESEWGWDNQRMPYIYDGFEHIVYLGSPGSHHNELAAAVDMPAGQYSESGFVVWESGHGTLGDYSSPGIYYFDYEYEDEEDAEWNAEEQGGPTPGVIEALEKEFPNLPTVKVGSADQPIKFMAAFVLANDKLYVEYDHHPAILDRHDIHPDDVQAVGYLSYGEETKDYYVTFWSAEVEVNAEDKAYEEAKAEVYRQLQDEPYYEDVPNWREIDEQTFWRGFNKTTAAASYVYIKAPETEGDQGIPILLDVHERRAFYSDFGCRHNPLYQGASDQGMGYDPIFLEVDKPGMGDVVWDMPWEQWYTIEEVMRGDTSYDTDDGELFSEVITEVKRLTAERHLENQRAAPLFEGRVSGELKVTEYPTNAENPFHLKGWYDWNQNELVYWECQVNAEPHHTEMTEVHFGEETHSYDQWDGLAFFEVMLEEDPRDDHIWVYPDDTPLPQDAAFKIKELVDPAREILKRTKTAAHIEEMEGVKKDGRPLRWVYNPDDNVVVIADQLDGLHMDMIEARWGEQYEDREYERMAAGFVNYPPDNYTPIIGSVMLVYPYEGSYWDELAGNEPWEIPEDVQAVMRELDAEYGFSQATSSWKAPRFSYTVVPDGVSHTVVIAADPLRGIDSLGDDEVSGWGDEDRWYKSWIYLNETDELIWTDEQQIGHYEIMEDSGREDIFDLDPSFGVVLIDDGGSAKIIVHYSDMNQGLEVTPTSEKALSEIKSRLMDEGYESWVAPVARVARDAPYYGDDDYEETLEQSYENREWDYVAGYLYVEPEGEQSKFMADRQYTHADMFYELMGDTYEEGMNEVDPEYSAGWVFAHKSIPNEFRYIPASIEYSAYTDPDILPRVEEELRARYPGIREADNDERMGMFQWDQKGLPSPWGKAAETKRRKRQWQRKKKRPKKMFLHPHAIGDPSLYTVWKNINDAFDPVEKTPIGDTMTEGVGGGEAGI